MCLLSIIFVSALQIHCDWSLPIIDQATRNAFGSTDLVNIMITMVNSTFPLLEDLKLDRSLSRKEKALTIVQRLQAFSKSSQKRVMKLLEEEIKNNFFQVESLWITNQIILRNVDFQLLDKLAKLEDIRQIGTEFFIPLEDQIDLEIFDHLPSSNESELIGWGVDRVEAPEVWESGDTGEGVIVCSIDTGVRRSHEALKNNFVGKFGWYDAVSKKPMPYDDFGHGTHIMGTMAGGKKIGVAPGSKWSACKACGPRGCSNFLLLICGQWVACPTNGNETDSDCSHVPHVIGNSWGGEIGNDWFSGVTKVWNSIGIISVSAIGNIGPKCGTANSPGDYDDVIGVGASCRNDTVARFSSVGPSNVSTRIKPDVVAPGHKILSAFNLHDNSYATLSGSSMASPCAAGVVALMLGKDKSLSFEDVRSALEAGSYHTKASGRVCSGKDDSHFPNFQGGYGRISARKSIEALKTRKSQNVKSPR